MPAWDPLIRRGQALRDGTPLAYNGVKVGVQEVGVSGETAKGKPIGPYYMLIAAPTESFKFDGRSLR